jgi:hypothetical protein
MSNKALQQTPTFSQQAAQQYQQAQNQAQGLNLSQLAAQAHNQFNSAYNQYAQQGMNQALAAQQYNQARQQQYQHHMWVWNGLPMDIVDFARHAYGDTPEATHFILKYKETV